MATNTKKSKTKPKKPKTKKPARRKKPLPKKATARKSAPKKKRAPKNRRVRGRRQDDSTVVFDRAGLGARSGGQSGDLQGLSNAAGADSESVDELLEEGNAFEAEIVEGVENAPDADQGGIKTREVPEDDVPDEYLNPDR
jgi:hypothetical protein